ncbi:DUF4287 domain-containing protein [Nesterenkonia sphaerica]|uniref:DUF4287 domain-containing protein n=1 Tax=Nesterenkonia sphaerica TaxID=1804988 RepID=A0A5R9AKR4_9MICC|nr:DUF4287 domain-containing protein [Nesterenkonia sphaerica]TLP79389.1 DUF4287 domain-containing protein [Nesterenkonia sphaerica]
MSDHKPELTRLQQQMRPSAERYAQLRPLVLGESAPDHDGGSATSSPEFSDETIRAKTGHDWQEWVALIDAGPGRDAGHTAIATWVGEEHGVPGWWAQGVTVGYERITGRRLPGEMPDGTFTISRSKTIGLEWTQLRGLLDDPAARSALLPAMIADERSKPGVKAPKFTLTDPETRTGLGVLQFSSVPAKAGGRLTVTHEKLSSPERAEAWKQFWAAWLDDLAAVD